MDWSFVVALVVGVIALILFLVGVYVDRTEKAENIREDRRTGGKGPKFGGKFALVIAVLFFAWSCLTFVSANSLGFIVSAGKPSAVLQNGPHLKAPWADKTEFDGRHKFLRFEPDPHGEGVVGPIQVRLSGDATAGATAYINGAVEWQIRVDTPEARAKALQLFKDYKSLESVRDNYLFPRLKTALGQVFADVNPLVASKNINGAILNQLATDKLREIVGDTITIHSVVLGVPDWDEITDKAIANLQTEMANTAAAEQKVKTAEQEKIAADLLAQLGNSDTFLVNKCIDAALTAILRGQPVEPGLCMSGASSVIANTK